MDKELKKHIEEKNKAIVLSVQKEDIYPFKKFYEKWYAKGFYDRPLQSLGNDKQIKIIVYKLAMDLLGVDFDTKLKASQWLTINGFNPYLR